MSRSRPGFAFLSLFLRIRQIKSLHLVAYLCLFCCLCPPTVSTAGDAAEPFASWESFARRGEAKKLLAWMRCSLDEILMGKACMEPPAFAPPPFYGRFGLFVTLVKGGKVRGCYGAFDHRSDKMEDLLRDYLQGALKRDGRYRPLDAYEAADAGIVLTVAGRQLPVNDLEHIDTANYGIVVTFENNEKSVFVPAEIKNMEKLKEMLRGKEIYQLTVFRAITIK